MRDEYYTYRVKCANCRSLNTIYIRKGRKLKSALFSGEFFKMDGADPNCYNCEEDLKDNFVEEQE